MKPARTASFLQDKALLTAVALFAVMLAAVSTQVLRATVGHLEYALDDPYIHMAIAKNLARHGVWGTAPDAFSSASSSPLWTALLGLVFLVIGVHDWVPLVLNVGFALAALVVLNAWVRTRVGTLERGALLSAVVLFAPMVPMVWIGMEHSLNNLLIIILIWWCADTVNDVRPRRVSTGCLVAALAVATRLEGLFVIGGCAVALTLARRLRTGIALVAAGLVPLVLIGLWNVWHGWFFLPASVMMKQTVVPHSKDTLLPGVLQNLLHSSPPAVFVVALALGLLLAGRDALARRTLAVRPLLTIFVVASVLHLLFARFGFLYRYESYLMTIAVVAIGLAIQGELSTSTTAHKLLPPAEILTAIVVVAVIAGHERTLDSSAVLINTAGHIYRQQRQMARFVGRYYDHDAVALNDIGNVSYFTDARVYDLAGLASWEAASGRRAGTFDAAAINAWLLRDRVPIAIVYDFWYQPDRMFYRDWVRVGTWTTDEQDEPGQGAVTFYARDLETARTLEAHLREFQPSLPGRVLVAINRTADGQ